MKPYSCDSLLINNYTTLKTVNICFIIHHNVAKRCSSTLVTSFKKMPSSGECCGHAARSFLVWICWPVGAFLFGYPGFFPQSKVMHVWLIAVSELAAAANGCVSLCVSPIMDVKGVHCFSAFGMGFSTLSPWTGEAVVNKCGQEVYIDVYCPKAANSFSIRLKQLHFSAGPVLPIPQMKSLEST